MKITLDEIIAIANRGYGFAGLAKGDLLAEFIAQELADHYRPEKDRAFNLAAAAHAMTTAADQLQRVASALQEEA